MKGKNKLIKSTQSGGRKEEKQHFMKIIPLVNYRKRLLVWVLKKKRSCLISSFCCTSLHTLSVFFVCCRCFPSQGISSYVCPPWRLMSTLSLTPCRGKSRGRRPTSRLPPPFSFWHNTAEWPLSSQSQGRHQTPPLCERKEAAHTHTGVIWQHTDFRSRFSCGSYMKVFECCWCHFRCLIPDVYLILPRSHRILGITLSTPLRRPSLCVRRQATARWHTSTRASFTQSPSGRLTTKACSNPSPKSG